MIFVTTDDVCERPVKITTRIDDDGDLIIEANDLGIGYFSQVDGKFNRFYIAPQDREMLPTQWKLHDGRTTVETYEEELE